MKLLRNGNNRFTAKSGNRESNPGIDFPGSFRQTAVNSFLKLKNSVLVS